MQACLLKHILKLGSVLNVFDLLQRKFLTAFFFKVACLPSCTFFSLVGFAFESIQDLRGNCWVYIRKMNYSLNTHFGQPAVVQ